MMVYYIICVVSLKFFTHSRVLIMLSWSSQRLHCLIHCNRLCVPVTNWHQLVTEKLRWFWDERNNCNYKWHCDTFRHASWRLGGILLNNDRFVMLFLLVIPFVKPTHDCIIVRRRRFSLPSLFFPSLSNSSVILFRFVLVELLSALFSRCRYFTRRQISA